MVSSFSYTSQEDLTSWFKYEAELSLNFGVLTTVCIVWGNNLALRSSTLLLLVYKGLQWHKWLQKLWLHLWKDCLGTGNKEVNLGFLSRTYFGDPNLRGSHAMDDYIAEDLILTLPFEVHMLLFFLHKGVVLVAFSCSSWDFWSMMMSLLFGCFYFSSLLQIGCWKNSVCHSQGLLLSHSSYIWFNLPPPHCSEWLKSLSPHPASKKCLKKGKTLNTWH